MTGGWIENSGYGDDESGTPINEVQFVLEPKRNMIKWQYIDCEGWDALKFDSRREFEIIWADIQYHLNFQMVVAHIERRRDQGDHKMRYARVLLEIVKNMETERAVETTKATETVLGEKDKESVEGEEGDLVDGDYLMSEGSNDHKTWDPGGSR